MADSPSIFERLNHRLKTSITVRIFFIGILSLLLLIPAGLVQDLVQEREWRKNETIAEINSRWGNAQTITGPYLTIPYTYTTTDKDGDVTEWRSFFHLLPEQLDINGSLETEIRSISLFESVVYKSSLSLTGSFSSPSLEDLSLEPEQVLWDEASLEIGIQDMRGIRNELEVDWGGTNWKMEPGVSSQDITSSGVSVRTPNILDSTASIPFSLEIELDGSERLYFVPMGRKTEVHLESQWPHPGFNGAFLPEHDISTSGFTADWKVLSLNRNYPQQWKKDAYEVGSSTFGVDLVTPVADYQKTIRSLKYALMTIGFTFLIFFFVEIRSGKRVHPIQFILVGLAIIVFYTLLISLAEHLGFNSAYLISAAAVMVLIAIYFQAIFKQGRMTAILLGVLTLSYGFVFTTLQLEDYALLIGSIGLFMVLAILMLLTRKVDWYALRSGKES